MYSESDFEAAVAAGVLSADAAAKFRAYVAGRQTAPAVDEEYFRLITGFNDIFVSIAILMVLTAAGVLSGKISLYLPGLTIAAASWGLSEYFTRQRRMALPSILLLLGFAGGIASVAIIIVIALAEPTGLNGAPWVVRSEITVMTLVAATVIALACVAHWRRFRVPITVAAGAAGACLFSLSALAAMFPAMRHIWELPVMLCGFGVFALALRWDMSDRARTTRRADVAFWLHLLAAPLIVHPVFAALGLLTGGGDMWRALVAIGIYLALAWVALLVDRRALLVSALGYVLFALTHVMRQVGAVGYDLALTALVIGAALLLLSAFWHKARVFALRAAPVAWRRQLPAM